MKTTKQLFFRAVVLCIAVLALPNTIKAQDYTYTDNGDGTATITRYTGSGGAVTIPDMIGSLSVTIIADSAFQNCTNLSSVTIGTNVTSIGNPGSHSDNPSGSLVFGNCTSLTNITIPNGVTFIGDAAFQNCTNLSSIMIPDSVTTLGTAMMGVNWVHGRVFANCTALTNVSLGMGIATIQNNTFQNCSNLASITIPTNVTTIAAGAFQNCTGLSSITIPTNVTSMGVGVFANLPGLTNAIIGGSVGNSMFLNCANLVSVTIDSSVTIIADSAFQNCTNLSSVTIGTNVTSIGNPGSHSDNPSGSLVFGNCTSLTNITIPNSVTFIGDAAFQNCTNLSSIMIPDSVTTLGTAMMGVNWVHGRVFANCTALTNVSLGNGVKVIQNNTFQNCSNLASITIPTNVPTIAAGAFQNCTSLSTIIIPDSVTSMGAGVFANCTGLTNAIIGGSVGSSMFVNCTNLVSVTIDSSVTIIADSAFQNCTSLRSITIPDSVTALGVASSWRYWDYTGQVFVNCTSLTNVTIGSGVTTIRKNTFLNCSNLSSITMSTNVNTINDGAFGDCTSLLSFTISASITNIGTYAFQGCTNLNTFTVDANNPNFSSLDGVLFDQTQKRLILYPIGKTNVNYTIPGSVTTIEVSAFENAYNLTGIAISDGVTNIAQWAFRSCVGLTNITISLNVASIGSEAFAYCYSLGAIEVSPGNLSFSSRDGVLFDKNQTTLVAYPLGKVGGNYSIPIGVTNIGHSAFLTCISLTNITIPNGVTTIGSYAFSDCSNLTSIVLPASITAMGNAFSGSGLASVTLSTGTTAVRESAFSGCGSLTNITIPDSVTSIGASAFSDCTSLTQIELPIKVNAIGEEAFYNCSNLVSMNLPASISSIGDYAFAGCSGLTDVRLPGSVTSIGEGAFMDCTGLTNIVIPPRVAEIKYALFEGCTSLTTVIIPASVTKLSDIVFSRCPLRTVFFLGNAPRIIGPPGSEPVGFIDFGTGDVTIYHQAIATGWPADDAEASPNNLWGFFHLVTAGSLVNQVSITAPSALVGAPGNPPLVISGTAISGINLLRVLVGLDGSPMTNVATFTGSSGNSTNWSYTWSPQPTTGNHTVFAQAEGDILGRSTVASSTFLYQVYWPLTIVTNVDGVASSAGGTVASTRSSFGTPTNGSQLMLGKSYTVTAVPALNNIFSNWMAVVDGVPSVLSTSAKVTFPMQSNRTLIANFVANRFIAAAGKYYGLFSETNGITPQSAGFFNVTVSARSTTPATFSGKLTLAGQTLGFSGSFDVAGDATIPLVFSFATVTLRLHVPDDGSDTLSGSVSNNVGSWVAELAGNRAVYKSTHPATAYAGAYTMLIPGATNAAEAPGGDGYGLVKVTSSGTISLSGYLGDGGFLQQSVPVSRAGDWPFYCAALMGTGGNAGIIMGWLSFSNGLSGTVSWIKPAVAGDVYYPAGFTNELDIVGSHYYKPATGARAISLNNGNGSLLLSGGNLDGVLSNNVYLSTLNKFMVGTNYGLSLQVIPTTGLLKGTFTNAVSGNVGTPLKGVVLWEQNEGGGFFKGTNQTGALRLQGN